MPLKFECDPEAVLNMQENQVGVEEILQYCHALLTNQEISQVIRGLENLNLQLSSVDEDDHPTKAYGASLEDLEEDYEEVAV